MRDFLRGRAERRRKNSGRAHVVHYFHDVDDPYSVLTAQLLGPLIERYDIRIEPHLVRPPSEGAAPEREMLDRYARADVCMLAETFGLEFTDNGFVVAGPESRCAAQVLANLIQKGRFVEHAGTVAQASWAGDTSLMKAWQQEAGDTASVDVARQFREGDALRTKLGHYLGGVFYYGGEWYWGVDRLHYLEQRLAELGARRKSDDVRLLAPPVPDGEGEEPAKAASIDFFLSLRSPYTYLVAERLFRLTRRCGATVNLKFVLPMVMRNLPVPQSKAFYIARDAKREANRLGLPFGKIADPVGRPTERGLAVLAYAVEQGKGDAFVVSFLRGVWSERIDAGSDRGLRVLAERAGLDWSTASQSLHDESWRAKAEAHRRELTGLGLWGVPSFRVGDRRAVWGQDRLWLVERALADRRS